MISVLQALGWLNAIDNHSRLNDEHKRLMGAAMRVRTVLDRVRNLAHSTKDRFEKAEILLCCAALEHFHGCFPEAVRDAQEALILYDDDDDHRRAVALWILGMAQWELCRNHDAYQNWVEAKKIFKQRQILFQHFPIEQNWYKNHIWHMDVALACHPEEIESWLNCFEQSNLRASNQQIIKSMHNNIRRQTYSNEEAVIRDLQEAMRDCEQAYEKAEIYLEFGLGFHKMGKARYAIELLRNAVQNFQPGIGLYHKQVVARWMLGAIKWTQPIFQSQAVTHWERCIEEFESLRRWADRDHLPAKEKWYAEHCAILRAALLEQRSQTSKPPQQAHRAPAEKGSPPSSSTSDSQNPDLYQDLLIKVRWDRAIADRLIEFERKKMPGANRNEWIKRAIERWMRDNK